MSSGDSASAPSEAPPAAPVPAEASPTARSPKKKREPVTTLDGFFARRRTKPAAFLKDLREAAIWRFDEDDVRLALESHAERDKDFARTTQLMAAALKEKDGSFARPVAGLVADAIRRRLADNPHFSGFDLGAADDVVHRLDIVARALAPRIRETGRRAESTNLLLATILWLHHTEKLDATTAVERLLVTLGVEPGRSTDRQRARLVWLGERPKEVRAVLDIVAPAAAGSTELAESLERAERRLGVEHEGRVDAEAEVVRLSRSLDELERVVEQNKTEIARLDEASRAARVHADHDVKQVKARVAGSLDGQLRDLIATIGEALSLDPPRIEVANEKVQSIVRELDRQVTWLKS